MNRTDLIEMLKGHKGCTPISMITVTEVKDINKVPYLKVSKVNGMLGYDYENAVDKRSDEEFTAGPRKWGKHVIGADGEPLRHLIEHVKDGMLRHYVQIMVQKSKVKPTYIDAQGRLHKQIELKPRATSKAESVGVIHREYSVDNIKSITMKGQHIRVA